MRQSTNLFSFRFIFASTSYAKSNLIRLLMTTTVSFGQNYRSRKYSNSLLKFDPKKKSLLKQKLVHLHESGTREFTNWPVAAWTPHINAPLNEGQRGKFNITANLSMPWFSFSLSSPKKKKKLIVCNSKSSERSQRLTVKNLQKRERDSENQETIINLLHYNLKSSYSVLYHPRLLPLIIISWCA